MLTKTIQFEDLDGNEIEGTFYFHLSKAELAKLELSHKGGLVAYLNTIVEAENGREIMKAFEDIIGMTVGVRSEDGKRFIKNDSIRDDFMQSEAFSELFVELIKDPKKAAEFINAVVPAKLLKEVAQESEQKEYTDAELIAMPQHEFDNLVGTNPSDMSKRHLQVAFHRKTLNTAS